MDRADVAQNGEPQKSLTMQRLIVIQVANRINPLSRISGTQENICDNLGMTACAEDQNTNHLAFAPMNSSIVI